MASKVYVLNPPCGHQHKTRLAALGCAGNMLHTHPNQPFVKLVRVTISQTGGLKESVLDTLPQRCTECGNRIDYTKPNHEYGHKKDCPTLNA